MSYNKPHFLSSFLYQESNSENYLAHSSFKVLLSMISMVYDLPQSKWKVIETNG